MGVIRKPPLRIPGGWKDQARSFVIQLQQIIDDIYSKLGKGGEGTSGVDDVSYSSGTLKKTVGGEDTVVVTAATLKSDMNLSKSDVGLGNVENKSAATILSEMTATEVTNALGYTPPSVDTKNTAGTTNKASTKLYLVGAETQATNPQTNSNSKVYIGTDNCLYSDNSKVLNQSDAVATATSISYIRKALGWQAVLTSGNWQLHSGENAAIGDYVWVNGVLGLATDTITGGSTNIVSGTNWDPISFRALNNLENGKADKVALATNGNFAALDANGNLTDSGHKHSDYLTSHQDISGKLDIAQGAANAGKFMQADSSGDLGPVALTKGHVGIWYGVCDTAAGTRDKAVSITGVTVYNTGDIFIITFSNAQDYNGGPRLNVNSLGVKNIRRVYGNNATRYQWLAGETLIMVYDGTYMLAVNNGLATTTYYGLTRLTSTCTSTSSGLALTASALNAYSERMIAGAALYDAEATYAVGDRVRNGWYIYQCKTAITTAEAWNAEHWDQLPSIQEQIDTIQQGGHVGAYTWGELANQQ